jgi:quinol monooxygenase YgiN
MSEPDFRGLPLEPLPVTLLARFRAKPGQEARLLQELKRLPGPTRAETGCITYELHQSQTDPALFVFYENWASQAALDAHSNSPHLEVLLKLVPELVEGRPEITKWTVVK